MATVLKPGWARTNRVRLNDEPVKLDPKDPIQGAVMGKIMRDIKNGDMDNIGNLQLVGQAFNVNNDNDTQQVIGKEQTTFVADTNGVEHECIDSKMLKTMLDSGCTLIRTEVRDILSG
jgi:hypothetical protein